MTIRRDATLRDAKSELANPDHFISQAFGVMHRIAKDHGDVRLRLGVTGTGQFPNYRIEDANSGEAVAALNGANHEPWPEGEKFDGVGTWSESTMSKQEVEELLGEIRNFSRKR